MERKGDSFKKGIIGTTISSFDKYGVTSLGHTSGDSKMLNEQRQVAAKRNSFNRIELILNSLKMSKRFSTEVFLQLEKVAEGRVTKEKWLDEVF